ncbi:NAD(P)-binding protein [Pyrenochaeta sp. DS3sAY3a]|nr:NAD(P)-binding protein [Pyrenochaeta sp. DS3sAY3a]
MSLPTKITAREAPGVYPPGTTSEFAKMRWGVKNPPFDPKVTFAGKTVLVTGANTGLGLEAAVKYAQKDVSKLIITVRSAAKGEETKATILQRSGRKDSAFISVLLVELSSFPSVQEFPGKLEEALGTSHLDIALLNAGVAYPTFELSAHGYERALQVNVLSTTLMALTVLPFLQKTAKLQRENAGDLPHLTFVNSAGHTEAQRAWYTEPPATGNLLAFLNTPASFDLRKSYCGVKLLGMAVMKHIAASVAAASADPADPDVIVNAMCPYYTRTQLARNMGVAARLAFVVWQWFTARTAEEGGRAVVSATVLGGESHGKFWHHDVLYP